MTVTTSTLKVLAAFDSYDLDSIMSLFSADCPSDHPLKPDQGISAKRVRKALSGRFEGIPDVQYLQDNHWLATIKDILNGRLKAPQPPDCIRK